jgi:hypothetical protein
MSIDLIGEAASAANFMGLGHLETICRLAEQRQIPSICKRRQQYFRETKLKWSFSADGRQRSPNEHSSPPSSQQGEI